MSSWREKFKSDIPEMDREHKQCLELADLLVDALESEQDKKIIAMIFDNLVSNIFKHFVAEELLMNDYSYPLSAQHESQHKEFIDFIASLREKILNHEIELTKDIITKIQVRFAKHVLGDDHQFVTYFNERNKI